jgi:hypothetical protein
VTENGTKRAALGGQWTFVDGRYCIAAAWPTSRSIRFTASAGSCPADRQGRLQLSGFGSFQQGMVRFYDSDVMPDPLIYLDLSAGLDRSRATSDSPGDGEAQFGRRCRDRARLARQHLHAEPRLIGAFGRRSTARRSAAATRSRRIARLRLPPTVEGLDPGRADGRLARGDVPFYMLPFIDMRGIPPPAFRGHHRSAETEVRYNLAALGRRLPGPTRMGQPGLVRRRDGSVSGGLGFRHRSFGGWSVRWHRRREIRRPVWVGNAGGSVMRPAHRTVVADDGGVRCGTRSRGGSPVARTRCTGSHATTNAEDYTERIPTRAIGADLTRR